MSWLDLRGLEAQEDKFELIPAGTYLMVCDKAEVKDTKTGGGQYIAATFKIIGPQYTNRLVWHNFNVKNQSEKAQKFGLNSLVHFMKACGIAEEKCVLDSPKNLEGMSCMVQIKIRKDDNYGDKNEVEPFGFTKYDELLHKPKQDKVPDFMR